MYSHVGNDGLALNNPQLVYHAGIRLIRDGHEDVVLVLVQRQHHVLAGNVHRDVTQVRKGDDAPAQHHAGHPHLPRERSHQRGLIHVAQQVTIGGEGKPHPLLLQHIAELLLSQPLGRNQ